jgi:hypothetical protein
LELSYWRRSGLANVMPKIAAILSDNSQSEKSISVMLSRDALFLDTEGIPSPGIGLSATQARTFAERLLTLAGEAESREAPEIGTGSGSILVVHDLTPRGERAFALALTLARESDAHLYLHVRDKSAWSGPGDVVEQCSRQLGVLRSVAARCAAEAASQGVRLKPCVLTIDGDSGAFGAPETDIDFLIMPRPDTSSERASCPANIGRYVVLVR